MVDLHVPPSNTTAHNFETSAHLHPASPFFDKSSFLRREMTTRDSVEDLESGAVGANGQIDEDSELERIKGNYRTTVIVPELPGTVSFLCFLPRGLLIRLLANYTEMQAAFQELQNELQEFLGHYIPKVTSLQSVLSSNLATGAAHDNRSEVFVSLAKPIVLIFFPSHHSCEQNDKGFYAHPKPRSGRW